MLSDLNLAKNSNFETSLISRILREPIVDTVMATYKPQANGNIGGRTQFQNGL
jgi:hypothetical protein